MRIVNAADPFSINDLGCGYGALLDYLDARGFKTDYTGIDVSPEMVRAAALRFEGRANADFICAARIDREADYSVASGIRCQAIKREATATRGIQHVERRFDVSALFDLCKRRYSKSVALLHDYGLYEFTILVRKAS